MDHIRRPDRFLNLIDRLSAKDTSAVWILPLPLERTTCFMEGTAGGPAAILDTSYQLELYDEYVEAEGAVQYGIHTLPTFSPRCDSIEEDVRAIQDYVHGLDLQDRLLVTLGGEHSITPGIVAG